MVLVEHPVFDKKGKRTGEIYSFEVGGTIEEKPQGAMIYIQMKQVAKRLAETPATTTSKFLEITRKTKIDFTPFCRPK